MQHSKKFANVRLYYKMGIYTKQMVGMLVGKTITAEEYQEIVGEAYQTPEN